MKTIIWTTLSALLLIGCNSKKNNENVSVQISDKNAIEQFNEIKQSPDQVFFDAKGPVKTIQEMYINKLKPDGSVYTFDEKGNCINLPNEYIRKDNRITGYSYTESFGEISEKYEYNDKGLIHTSIKQAIGNTTSTFEYDSDGMLILESCITEGSDEGEDYRYDEKYTYKYITFDEYGNWTERERTCSYVGDTGGYNNVGDTEIQKRIITYHNISSDNPKHQDISTFKFAPFNSEQEAIDLLNKIYYFCPESESDGVIPFKSKAFGYNYIDTMFNVLPNICLTSPMPFVNGLVIDGYLYINKKGEKSISLRENISHEYTSIAHDYGFIPHKFNEGFAVCEIVFSNPYRKFYGVIDTSGNVVIPFNYTKMDDCVNENTIVAYDSEYCYIIKINSKTNNDDTDSLYDVEYIITKYEKIDQFHNGFAIAYDNNTEKKVLIDNSGNEIPGTEHHYLQYIGENLYLKNNETIIDTNGKKIYTISNISIESTYNDGHLLIRNGYRYGYINKTGEIVITPKYTKASDFKDGVAIVNDGNSAIIIDVNGKELSKPIYQSIRNFTHGWAFATHFDGKGGFIDKNGNEVTAFEYSDNGFVYFSGEYATAQLFNSSTKILIHKSGEIVASTEEIPLNITLITNAYQDLDSYLFQKNKPEFEFKTKNDIIEYVSTHRFTNHVTYRINYTIDDEYDKRVKHIIGSKETTDTWFLEFCNNGNAFKMDTIETSSNRMFKFSHIDWGKYYAKFYYHTYDNKEKCLELYIIGKSTQLNFFHPYFRNNTTYYSEPL